MEKFLIVGLGNPGPEYHETRHNVGWMAIDAFAKSQDAVFEDKRFGFLAQTSVRGRKLFLLKPTTYMNLSGNAVRYWLEKENIPYLIDSTNDEEDDTTKIAIIGKPNVGKSSIINKLIGENRLIVSNIAGTTRDAIDTDVKYNGKKYTFIDTAGLRRKSKVKDELEHYMILRTVGAVERADVAILVINAEDGVTDQDAKIAGIAHESGKAVIIAVNKWDLIEKDNHSVKEFTKNIRNTLAFMNYADIIFISACAQSFNGCS